MIRFYLIVCLPYWIFVDYIFVQLNFQETILEELISTIYVRGYLQGSENGRVVTIGNYCFRLVDF
jgi:hypothetical protein